MKATEKYREKYAKKKGPIPVSDIYRANGYAPFRIGTPAGHADIYHLCDAVDRFKSLVEDTCLQVSGDLAIILRNRMNMILMDLERGPK